MIYRIRNIPQMRKFSTGISFAELILQSHKIFFLFSSFKFSIIEVFVCFILVALGFVDG